MEVIRRSQARKVAINDDEENKGLLHRSGADEDESDNE
jgi:hypothetical protein